MNDTTFTEEFDSEIEESGVPHRWSLSVDQNLVKNNDDKYFIQKTSGWFCCALCGRTWSSSRIVILFRMTLNKFQSQGIVTMRIFKQRCPFYGIPSVQEPTIPHDNIRIVICNVVNHIQKVFYGKRNVNDDRPPTTDYGQEGLHDEDRCEACQFNLCDRQPMSAQDAAIALGVGLVSAVVLGMGSLVLINLLKH